MVIFVICKFSKIAQWTAADSALVASELTLGSAWLAAAEAEELLFGQNPLDISAWKYKGDSGVWFKHPLKKNDSVGMVNPPSKRRKGNSYYNGKSHRTVAYKVKMSGKRRRVGRRRRVRRRPLRVKRRVMKRKFVRKRRVAVGRGGVTSENPDQTHSRFSIGRKASRKSIVYKLSQTALAPVITRWQCITVPDSAIGAIKFARNYGGAPPALGSYEIMPCSIFNLTNLGTAFNHLQGDVKPCAFNLVRYFTGPSTQSDYGFLPVAGRNAAGTAGANYYYDVEQGVIDGIDGSFKKAIHDWTSIGLDLISPVSKPTHWCIELVSFMDEFLQPEYLQSAGTGLYAPPSMPTLEEANKRLAFYDHLVSRFTVDELLAGTPNYTKGMRVLWSKSFSTASKETTESYQIGKEVFMKVFKRLNRLENFDYGANGRMPIGASIPNEPLGWAQNTLFSSAQSLGNDVQWKKRLYLMIRAFNPLANSDIYAPSFDIVIRNKYHVPFS